MDTNIVTSLNSITGDPRLDKAVKELLADKQVLSRIMQRTAIEFKDKSIDEIIKSIEGEPEICITRVEPGLTNAPERIAGSNTESSIPNEGDYYFDIKFYAFTGERDKAGFAVKIIFDIEPQNSYKPGYDLVSRGVYYAARMISSQYGTEFTKEEFGKLKKVYSVWICMRPPKYAANSIIQFAIKPDILYGNFPKETLMQMKYDLVNITLVHLSTEDNEDKDVLCGMLETLLDDALTKSEKIEKLVSEYGIHDTVEFDKEVQTMCDYSIGLAKKYEAKGEAKGRELERFDLLYNLVKDGTITVEQAAKKANISPEDFKNRMSLARG